MGMAPGIVRMHEHVTFRDFLASGEVCDQPTSGTCIFCTCIFTHGIPRLLLPAFSSTILRISPNFSKELSTFFYIFVCGDYLRQCEDNVFIFVLCTKPGTLKDFVCSNNFITTVGQGKNFQSQIGGNCDWKFFLHQDML